MQEIIIARKAYFTAGVVFRPPSMTLEQSQSLYGVYSQSEFGFGNNYTLEAYFQGPIDPKTGLVVNLSDIDPVLKSVIKPLDHQNLSYAVSEFKDKAPTLERLAQYCFEKILEKGQGLNAKLIRVRLYQGENYWSDYGHSSSGLPVPPLPPPPTVGSLIRG